MKGLILLLLLVMDLKRLVLGKISYVVAMGL